MSDTISIPSVLLFGTLLFFTVRYFFFSRATPSTSNSRSNAFPGAQRVDAAKVDQVTQMFPDQDRRAIAWDLSRNGGSVQATTEKILGGQNLDTPPPSFHPPNLIPASTSPSTMGSGSTGASSGVPHKQESLISRYNLASRVKAHDDFNEESTTEPGSTAKGWATTKSERTSLLNNRRDEMILNARRKMEAKVRREAKGKGRAVD